MPRAPFELLLAEALVAFHKAFPDVELEIAVEARMVDIVKERFDGGIRYGNNLQKDMVAVPIAPKSEAILAASPAYLAIETVPICPSDLLNHRGLMCRSQSTGVILPWLLEHAGGSERIIPGSTTVVHDLASQIQLAVKGLGILSAPAALISEQLETGKLSRVLPGWSTPLEPLYLYFPSRRHQSAALRAFVGFLTLPKYSDQRDLQSGNFG
jgi:DNA-binding transcriptional LysR family regulator